MRTILGFALVVLFVGTGCPVPVADTCGDDVCGASETCETCAQDCGVCNEPTCGDDACNGDETCATCAADCGDCNLPACGDGRCLAPENCALCAVDCGPCAEPEPSAGEPGVPEPSAAPSVGEPSVGEPAVSEPSVGEPSVGEPSVTPEPSFEPAGEPDFEPDASPAASPDSEPAVSSSTCPNGSCEDGENAENCPQDCAGCDADFQIHSSSYQGSSGLLIEACNEARPATNCTDGHSIVFSDGQCICVAHCNSLASMPREGELCGSNANGPRCRMVQSQSNSSGLLCVMDSWNLCTEADWNGNGGGSTPSPSQEPSPEPECGITGEDCVYDSDCCDGMECGFAGCGL